MVTQGLGVKEKTMEIYAKNLLREGWRSLAHLKECNASTQGSAADHAPAFYCILMPPSILIFFVSRRFNRMRDIKSCPSIRHS
jgi:hypothetical protein